MAQTYVPGDGNDSPAWSRKRGTFAADDVERRVSAVAYAELHAHSAYSFLDGASMPEEMVAQARALDLKALALTDHDGFYGIVRFAEAARNRSRHLAKNPEKTEAKIRM